MKIGLFFGSFNPVHIGHLIIANHFLEFTELEQIWFVVSPQNPLKSEDSLVNADIRLKMVKVAIAVNKRFRVCDAEFSLSQPSYTINTLRHLKSEHPWYDFFIIMGSDSFAGIRKWKDYKSILSSYPIYIYQRRDFPVKDIALLDKVTVFDFPYIDISATYIRKLLEEGKSVQFLVPEKILAFLKRETEYKC